MLNITGVLHCYVCVMVNIIQVFNCNICVILDTVQWTLAKNYNFDTMNLLFCWDGGNLVIIKIVRKFDHPIFATDHFFISLPFCQSYNQF